jgi:hypothetical protein
MKSGGEEGIAASAVAALWRDKRMVLAGQAFARYVWVVTE